MELTRQEIEAAIKELETIMDIPADIHQNGKHDDYLLQRLYNLEDLILPEDRVSDELKEILQKVHK